MTIRELIKAEIDDLSEKYLGELYELIKDFAQSKQRASKSSLMAKLKSIQIDAPEDFATNLDLYTAGEKRAEPNLR